MHPRSTFLFSSTIAALSLLLWTAPLDAQPSFDCKSVEVAVHALICTDPGLSALDRELDEIWTRGVAGFGDEDRTAAEEAQRGWMEARDGCSKSGDPDQCIRAAYERRITELQIQGGLVLVPDYVSYECTSGDWLTATFYESTKTRAAVLTWNGEEQVIAFAAPTERGVLYQVDEVSMRGAGAPGGEIDEVTVTWRGTETTCSAHASTGSSEEGDPCAGLPSDASFVVATAPRAGAVVASSFDVSGCSRTFESNVTWRLRARDGSVVEEGFTSGGGVDGPAPFRFTVDAGAANGLHHLEVDEPKISDEGFPPGRTVLPVVLAGPGG